MNTKIIAAAAFSILIPLSALSADVPSTKPSGSVPVSSEKTKPKPSYDKLNDKLDTLGAMLADQSLELIALKRKSAFHLTALFSYVPLAGESKKTADERALFLAEVEKLPLKSFGLPTPKYDWPCRPPNDCSFIGGNISWRDKDTGGLVKKAPNAWQWSHVAIRTFSTSIEADLWLTNTAEGQFIKRYADVVFTSSTTMYGD
jgi:hypothetical protein